MRASGSGHSPCPVRAASRAGASVPARAQRRGARPVVRGQARHLPGEVLDLLPIDFDPLLQGFDVLGLPLLLLRGRHAAAGANWRRSTGGVSGPGQSSVKVITFKPLSNNPGVLHCKRLTRRFAVCPSDRVVSFQASLRGRYRQILGLGTHDIVEGDSRWTIHWNN